MSATAGDAERFLPADKLGEGAYGSVSTVYRESDGAAFAAKSFTADEDNGTQECGTLREVSMLVALQREARSALGRAHPNIVPVEAITEIDGIDGLCMIMPKMCMSLGTAIEAKALGKDDKMRVAIGVVRALAFLHANHVIHRDVKPDNVLLTDAHEPVLADFSLAKVIPRSSTAAPAAGAKAVGGGGKAARKRKQGGASAEQGAANTQGIGTPTYMAPEVVNGDGGYSTAADVWSAGVVLYELFNGETLQVTKDKAAFRLLDEVRAKLSTQKAVPALLRKMIAVDPAERISAAAALGELEAAHQQVGACAKSTGSAPTAPSDDAEQRKLVSALPFFERWASGGALDGSTDQNTADNGGAAGAAKKQRGASKGKAGAKPGSVTSMVKAACSYLDATNPLTARLAVRVAELTGAEPLHCTLVCAKLLELELPDIESLEDEEEYVVPALSAEPFEMDAFIDAEIDIMRKLDFSLYCH